MKAIVYHAYGSPDVLRLEEIDKPIPADNEVLLRVRAASVNPLDWHFMRGTPGFLRFITGLGKPKSPRLGRDVAGQVEAVGKNVTQFKPGDEVYGTGRGAFAEYACAPATELAVKPASVAYEQAASVPIAGLTALQSLRDKARVEPGQRVLINGAAGGVGTFAVQMAHSFGVEVTAVCSGRNIEMVRALGAQQVIDYTREDFIQGPVRYDAILDCVGNHPFSACRRVMNPHGVYVGIGGGAPDVSTGAILAHIMKNTALSWFVSQKMSGILAKSNTADLSAINELMIAGKITPVIDRQYTLGEVPEAIRYLEQGHARGKVVIAVRQ
jgi:NADPH:quinone reductase-like Zn-dependent oxidoreductase